MAEADVHHVTSAGFTPKLPADGGSGKVDPRCQGGTDTAGESLGGRSRNNKNHSF